MNTIEATQGPTLADYHQAATILWGDAGAFAVDEFARLNELHFGGELPPLPIVIGITAFGKCLGATRDASLPRITLASNIFAPTEHGRGRPEAKRPACGANVVRDVLLHEMIHARLMIAGENSHHNGEPWIREITRLSPVVLGHEVRAEPVKNRRIREGGHSRVVRRPRDGYLPRKAIACWPYLLRPAGFDRGPELPVESY